MRPRMMTFIFFLALFIAIDIYLFQAVLAVSRDWSATWKSVARYGFWVPTVLSVLAIMWWAFSDPYTQNHHVRSWIVTGLVGIYFSKIFGLLFVFVDDIQRGVRWVAGLFTGGDSTTSLPGEPITRSDFLTKAALVATAVPFGTMAYGIISGAHDYRIRKKTVVLPNLPKSFDGLVIGHVSDIHSGSFWNKTAVSGGVDMLLNEKPDIIFFTGDLVNNEATEVKDFINIFNKFKAPLGVYSVTGNHDYGDYRAWATQGDKEQNFRDLVAAHRTMGFNILMNENKIIQQGSDKIAIMGVENWGAGRWTKYGRLDKAHAGTEEAAVKLLLSHDPSHWDAQVRPSYADIDMQFAGHTHGFQFGIELPNFKWSPSQYAYKQWAGLYNEGKQYLYVNRGFGYLGYPGRIGMPPELTLIELKSA